MIFTNCPYCDEPQTFGYEAGYFVGYVPSKCHECGNVMWVEMISCDGETQTHENFKKGMMKKSDEYAARATNLSGVIYSD